MQAIADSITNKTKSEEDIIKDIEKEFALTGNINGNVQHENTTTSLLCLASYSLKPTVVHFLLRRKANVNYNDSEGTSPLRKVTAGATRLTEAAGLKIVVDLLIAGAEVCPRALYNAATRGMNSIVNELLVNNCATSFVNKYQGSALCVAAYRGHVDVCKSLLEMGKVNADSRKNLASSEETPLMLACQSGFVEIVKLLLENGANVKKKDCNGNLAIHHAAASGSIQCLEILLQKDSTLISQANGSPELPLDRAIQHLHLTCCDFLLGRGSPRFKPTTWRWLASKKSLPLLKAFVKKVPATDRILPAQLSEFVFADFVQGAEFLFSSEVNNMNIDIPQLSTLVNVARSKEMKELLGKQIERKQKPRVQQKPQQPQKPQQSNEKSSPKNPPGVKPETAAPTLLLSKLVDSDSSSVDDVPLVVSVPKNEKNGTNGTVRRSRSPVVDAKMKKAEGGIKPPNSANISTQGKK